MMVGMSVRRHVPTTYQALVDAINDGQFPAERSWIDFKREFYPTAWPSDPQKAKEAKDRKHRDIAVDMASMAVYGGYIVYGVEEDKRKGTFSPYPQVLALGLREKIDNLARDLITPALYVEITPVPDPDNPDHGFIVVEVPASPDAPHQVEFVYRGRSDTGNVQLTDDQVQRLMQQRGQRDARLIQEDLASTETADPVPVTERRFPHLHFVAVPTRGWKDMFAHYTRDTSAQILLLNLCRGLSAQIGGPQASTIFSQLRDVSRSARTGGAWLTSRMPEGPQDGVSQLVGVDDDGTIRFIDCDGGTDEAGLSGFQTFATRTGAPVLRQGPRVVHNEYLRYRVSNMLSIVYALSDEVGYPGTWSVAVRVDNIGEYAPQQNGRVPPIHTTVFDDEEYQFSAVVTRQQLADPDLVAVKLFRQLYRGMGVERHLPDL